MGIQTKNFVGLGANNYTKGVTFRQTSYKIGIEPYQNKFYPEGI